MNKIQLPTLTRLLELPFRLALFGALGFLLTTWGTTNVDRQLTSHVIKGFGSRVYPMPLWFWIPCAVVIFAVTLKALDIFKSWQAKVAAPPLILIGAGIYTLPAFLPEWPHGGIVFWMFFYALASLGGSWMHFAPLDESWLSSSTTPRDMKIERLKEHVTLSRTVAVSLTFGCLALLIPWINLNWTVSARIVTKTNEIFVLSQFAALETLLLSVFVMSCVITEAFWRAKRYADLLTKIPGSP